MRDWERVHALLAGEPHAWLLTSSEGVRNLEELAREHLTVDETLTLKHAPLVTPHPRIAEAARQAGFDRITVSGAGDERIVQALGGIFCEINKNPNKNPTRRLQKRRNMDTRPRRQRRSANPVKPTRSPRRRIPGRLQRRLTNRLNHA